MDTLEETIEREQHDNQRQGQGNGTKKNKYGQYLQSKVGCH